MSAVLLAVFNDYAAADRVRTELVEDGFPTDRVELTAACEPGRAALLPGDTLRERFARYFHTLFKRDDERDLAEQFAASVESGAATVTVHPRGPVEIARATQILRYAEAAGLAEHELADQAFEHAAARNSRPWLRNLLWESSSPDLCIYCRLFEHGPPAESATSSTGGAPLSR